MDPLIVFSLGFLCGLVGANWRTLLRAVRPAPPTWNGPQPPPSRILKPFATSPKRKPRVNNDEKAWLAENKR
jgi:hypothetical protein